MTPEQVFGPVPSRRLGSSLGISNVLPKTCSYACVYCQLGNLPGITSKRRAVFDPGQLVQEVAARLNLLAARGERPDYLTIVPDGEPTLDLNLASLIEGLKPLGVKIALISNGSTLDLAEVRQSLSMADWVSIKMDSLREEVWKKVNRPHGKIRFEDVRSGILEFSREYQGFLAMETMLVKDLNDSREDLEEVASFLGEIKPDRAYLAVPTRPPAEDWVFPAAEGRLAQGYQIFQEHGVETELLIGYEGNQFSSTGDLESDLLSITAVHPLREDAVDALVHRSGGNQAVVRRLIAEGRLARSEYQGQRYYIRKFT